MEVFHKATQLVQSFAKRVHSPADVAPNSQDVSRTRAAKYAGRMFLLLFGLARLWAGTQSMNGDGLSYLEIGDACFHGNWKAIVNLHWSPLYPFILGAARRIFPVPMKWELPVVHTVNFVIFVVVILCFEFFWGTVFTSGLNPHEDRNSAEAAWWITGYAMFAVTAHMQRAVEILRPDLMVTGFLLLAGAFLVRVRAANSRLTDFPFLGIVLGFGYLAKAPVFPMAFVFFAAAAIGRKFDRRVVARLCLMILAFAMISAPFAVLLSKRNGSFTFGQSGKVAYLWVVNHVSWVTARPGFGTPIHSPRQIWHSPDVYEFGSPFHVTYPLTYDVYYWHEGIRPHLDLREMAHVAISNSKEYVRYFFFDYYVPCLTILLVLAGLRGNLMAMFRDLLKQWPLLLVAACGLGMFAAILVFPYYVAGYLLLLWATLFLATGAFRASSSRLALVAALTLAIMVLPMLRRGVIEERQKTAEQDNVNKAMAVWRAGVSPDDNIAYIGEPRHAYWAKLDRVFIVAAVRNYLHATDDEYNETYESDTFWQYSESAQAAAYDAVRTTGAVAILAPMPSTASLPAGWKQVGGTQLCIRFLR